MLGICFLLLLLAGDDNWTQFRGPNASGVASNATPPVELSAKTLLWKRAGPPGQSSPFGMGDHIFLTSFDPATKKFEVLCLGKTDGAILWRRPVEAKEIQSVHAVSNPASAIPVVDAERVYVYFASVGLLAYSHAGELQWSLPLPTPATNFGSGTSPVIAGDFVILNADATADGYLIAVDRKTGKTAWKQPYAANKNTAESYSTPVVFQGNVVLHRRNIVDAYDLKDGHLAWSAPVASNGTSTVVASGDVVYTGAWNPVGEKDQRGVFPTWAELLEKYDKDGDGLISENEFPADLFIAQRPDVPNIPGATIFVKKFFPGIDANHDGKLQKEEWEAVLKGLTGFPDHGLLALKPDGSAAKTVWQQKTGIPEVPSPLLYRSRIFLTRNGGVVTCLDAEGGQVNYRSRVGAGGPYFASPVAADGHVYLTSSEGIVTVIDAESEELEVVARNNLGEDVYATPALLRSSVLVRGASHLFAFGSKNEDQTFQVKLETSAGNILLEVHPNWAPLGAARFRELVAGKFYDDSRFFRVTPRFAQFGIPGDPALSAKWRDKAIADDPRSVSNTRGTFAFAMTGPNTRTTQIYIAITDMSAQNDSENFAPLGRVVEGMEVVEKLYNAYGETAGGGMRGGKQGRIFAEGNAHLDRDFPKLDKLIRATIQ